jgi:hypothetical protein
MALLVFGALKIVIMKSTVLWEVTPCSPLQVRRILGQTSRLFSQGRRIGRANKDLLTSKGLSKYLPSSPEYGNRSSSRNAVLSSFLVYRTWTKFKIQVNPKHLLAWLGSLSLKMETARSFELVPDYTTSHPRRLYSS